MVTKISSLNYLNSIKQILFVNFHLVIDDNNYLSSIKKQHYINWMP